MCRYLSTQLNDYFLNSGPEVTEEASILLSLLAIVLLAVLKLKLTILTLLWPQSIMHFIPPQWLRFNKDCKGNVNTVHHFLWKIALISSVGHWALAWYFLSKWYFCKKLFFMVKYDQTLSLTAQFWNYLLSSLFTDGSENTLLKIIFLDI